MSMRGAIKEAFAVASAVSVTQLPCASVDYEIRSVTVRAIEIKMMYFHCISIPFIL